MLGIIKASDTGHVSKEKDNTEHLVLLKNLGFNFNKGQGAHCPGLVAIYPNSV